MNQQEKRYIGFHLLRTFFEDLASWREVSALAGIQSEISQLDYDFLFKGTAADIYVPLWASACLTGMDILLNEITLEVVLFYKRYGYEPIRMDGNPPDYIGEQFRFLEYLARCGLAGDREAGLAVEEFIDNFALDTFRGMGKALRRQTEDKEIAGVLSLAEGCLNGGELELADVDPTCFDSWYWRRNPPLPAEPPRRISHASFNDCGNKCKMISTVQEGCVLSVGPDRETPLHFSGCPRGASYRGTFLNARRLRYPMERVGRRGEGRFRRITWDEAAGKVADIIAESRRQGPGSRYIMTGTGMRAALKGSDMLRRLLAADGGYVSYYGSYSMGCAIPVLPKMFGLLRIANHEEEMLRSELLILWGNNLVTNHFGSAQKRMLMRAKEKGVKIIVIDPRQSDTALAAADQWIPIRPSTDSALVDAMCRIIWKRGLHDQAFIDRFCVGFDDEHLPEGIPAGESYFAYLDGRKDGVEKTPEWASAITGIPAGVIEKLALDYAGARYACILPGLGPQRTLNGEQTYRSIMTLPCLVGSIAKPGGGVITWSHDSGPQPEMPALENPYPISIPSFQWWRAVECPETLDESRGLRGAAALETNVRYLFSIASGMLLNQHSDINHTMDILQREGLVRAVVLSDVFMTPSAKAADLLLPAPSFFETDNICPPWAGEDYVLYNHAAIAPLFETKLELEWLTDAAKRLGLEAVCCGNRKHVQDWLRCIWEDFRLRVPEAPCYEDFRESSLALLRCGRHPLAFWENIEEGVPFATSSGKIEIFCREFYEKGRPGIPGIPAYTPVDEGPGDRAQGAYPLQLVGFHSKRRCHSIHDQNKWLDELEEPCLWINPDDAEERGLCDGQLADVFNGRGRVRLPVFVTRRIMEGVVAMSEGGWYTPDRDGVDIRGSINVLTMSHKATPLANANPQHTNLVQVCPAQGEGR